MNPADTLPLHVRDWFLVTQGMNRCDIGSLACLCAYYWAHGGLPADDDAIREVARCELKDWTRTKGRMLGLFEFKAGRWTHSSMDAERAQALKAHAGRIAIASEGGKARQQQVRQTAVQSVTPTAEPEEENAELAAIHAHKVTHRDA